MEHLEQRACDRDLAVMQHMAGKLTPEQWAELLTAAGCELPESLKRRLDAATDGSMMCCGNSVPEGERCPTCGDLNWKL